MKSIAFNITVELPLKSIISGFSYKIIPISWRNRKTGTSKLKIKEMGSAYFMICAKIWMLMIRNKVKALLAR